MKTLLRNQRFFWLMLVCCLSSVFATAQPTPGTEPEMADLLRSNGKIYTVVAVCLLILSGLFLYLFSIERRLKKIEKENKPGS
ncbi:MAG: CcmD family protein [Ferruginibacter sp.]